MKSKRYVILVLSFLLVLGCFVAPAGAIVASDSGISGVIMRATGRFETTIPANSILLVGENFILGAGDVVSYECTYTPRNASVKFGYIAPDGYFYGLSGSSGSINGGIRVSKAGTYTLAIRNKSDVAVTVKGTVNYWAAAKRGTQ